jgi:hypothetical protein
MEDQRAAPVYDGAGPFRASAAAVRAGSRALQVGVKG